ncbi:MAG: lytic transglycosylase domain-containing protein [Candidatus Aenigmarchaeota archaeon]|nr:lytic transglycosylase domain-containing protein [Candidatus Aenigmarchaeota archaeon]
MKASVSEIILTIGVLLSVFILLLQLRNYFSYQQKLAQGELLKEFEIDIYSLLEKSKQTSGNVNFEYSPMIKKYELRSEDNKISIYDSISKKTAFIYSDIKIDDAEIKDSQTLCFEKIKNCDENSYKISIKSGNCERSFESECYVELEKLEQPDNMQGYDPNDLPLDNCETDTSKVIEKIAAEARKQGVKPSIAIAIATIESSLIHCRADGTVKVNSIGAVGLMQLMPGTCDNPYDINRNIQCGIRLLKHKCRVSAEIASHGGFYCTSTDSCESGVSCVYDCSRYNFRETYTGWDLALRAYNGWGCCVRTSDGIDCTGSAAIATRNYVNLVNGVASRYTMYD